MASASFVGNGRRDRPPKQSWWGSVYCKEDLHCGNSGFPWDDSNWENSDCEVLGSDDDANAKQVAESAEAWDWTLIVCKK